MRSRHTEPPKVLPLIPVCVVATMFAAQALGAIVAVLTVVGVLDRPDDASTAELLAVAAGQVLLAVPLWFASTWLVERWSTHHPPRRGPRYDS